MSVHKSNKLVAGLEPPFFDVSIALIYRLSPYTLISSNFCVNKCIISYHVIIAHSSTNNFFFLPIVHVNVFSIDNICTPDFNF